MIPANFFVKDDREKRKKVEFRQFFPVNSTFFLFALTSLIKELAGIKDFAYFVTFVTIVIKLNFAHHAIFRHSDARRNNLLGNCFKEILFINSTFFVYGKKNQFSLPMVSMYFKF